MWAGLRTATIDFMNALGIPFLKIIIIIKLYLIQKINKKTNNCKSTK